MHVFGPTPFAARLPSAIATVATLALLSVVLPRIIGHRRAFWSTFVFATALLPTYLSKVGMTDATLNLTITAGMLCLFSIWRGTARWPTMIGLGVAIGAGLRVKGPPIFLFLGMTLVALWVINATLDDPESPRRTYDLQRLLPAATMKTAVVFGIALLICLPWVRALELAHPGAIATMLQKEIVARGAVPQEGHSGPPGYYAIAFWGTYFPWCLLWPAAIVAAWRRRRIAWVRFSLAAVLGPWVFLELYRTKLPHYWLPSFPFMAILTADVLLRAAGARIYAMRDRAFAITATIVAAVVTLAGAIPLGLVFLGDGPRVPSILTGLALLATIAFASWTVAALIRHKRLLAAAGMMGGGFWAAVVVAFALYWPATPSLTLARRVGTELQLLQQERPGAARMIEFKEPSLAFYQGGTIRGLGDPAALASPANRPRWLVTEESVWRRQPDAVRAGWSIERTFHGLNLADEGLRPRTIVILENRPVPTTLPVDAR
jgi:4-amino-4-deoxy-L-arabinose transferase-like glycosyltransferase